MKLNMKTWCSVGALLLCSESALAMKEVSNENRSAHPTVVQLKENTGSVKIMVHPSIAD